MDNHWSRWEAFCLAHNIDPFLRKWVIQYPSSKSSASDIEMAGCPPSRTPSRLTQWRMCSAPCARHTPDWAPHVSKAFLRRSRWRQRQLLSCPRNNYPISFCSPFLAPFSPPKYGASPPDLQQDTPLLQYHESGIRAQSRYGRHYLQY
jgi:hypothetical protein